MLLSEARKNRSLRGTVLLCKLSLEAFLSHLSVDLPSAAGNGYCLLWDLPWPYFRKNRKLKLVPGCGFFCFFLHWPTVWACESNWGCVSRLSTLKNLWLWRPCRFWTVSSLHNQCFSSDLQGMETPHSTDLLFFFNEQFLFRCLI